MGMGGVAGSQRLLLGQIGTDRTAEWGAKLQNASLVRSELITALALRRDQRGILTRAFGSNGWRVCRYAGCVI